MSAFDFLLYTAVFGLLAPTNIELKITWARICVSLLSSYQTRSQLNIFSLGAASNPTPRAKLLHIYISLICYCVNHHTPIVYNHSNHLLPSAKSASTKMPPYKRSRTDTDAGDAASPRKTGTSFKKQKNTTTAAAASKDDTPSWEVC